MAEHPHLLPAPSAHARASDQRLDVRGLGPVGNLDIEEDDALQEEQGQLDLALAGARQQQLDLLGDQTDPSSALGVVVLWLIVLLLAIIEAGTLVGPACETAGTSLRALSGEPLRVLFPVVGYVGFGLVTTVVLAEVARRGLLADPPVSRPRWISGCICALTLLLVSLALAGGRLTFEAGSLFGTTATSDRAAPFAQILVTAVAGVVTPLVLASIGGRALTGGRLLRRHLLHRRGVSRLERRRRQVLAQRRRLRDDSPASSHDPHDHTQE